LIWENVLLHRKAEDKASHLSTRQPII